MINPICIRAIGGVVALIFGISSVQATTLVWDSDSAIVDAQDGAGGWTAGGANFWNGATNIATANDLLTDIAQFGNGGVLASSTTVNTGTQSINGLIFGATLTSGYSLTNSSASTLTVGGGGITLNSGAQATQLGSSGLSIALGAVQTWSNNSNRPLIFGGIVNGGAKTLTVNGTGPVTFSAGFTNLGLNSIFNTGTTVNITADSTVSTALFANGNTTISAGTTQSTTDQFIVVNTTGILTVSGAGILSGARYRIGSTSGQEANFTVTGSGQVTVGSSLTFSHAGGTVGSKLNLNGGTFTLPVGLTMTGIGAVNFNGGLLKLTNTLADLKASGAGALTLNVSGGALIDVAATKTVAISTPLSHAGTAATDGGLTKTGGGTLELKAFNSYTGATRVNAGTLVVSTTSLNNFASVTVATGAVLQINHSQTDVVAGLTLGGVVKPNGVYNASNSGGFITGTGSIQVNSTPTADPFLDAMGALRNHINGAVNLTASQINAQTTVIKANVSKLASNTNNVAEALSLVTLHDAKKGALFTVAPTKTDNWQRTATGFELPNAMFALQQGILDYTYTASSLALHESLLNGWKMGSCAHFPGSVAPPADPTVTRSVVIKASQPNPIGAPVMYEADDARRPTGNYLAPGSIATVTVPASMVNKNFKVRVGAHSWDLANKDNIQRFDDVSTLYTITSTTTKVANPLGGGIYIEVPLLATAGIVTIQITNAVRSPFYSAVSFRPKTTLAEWQNVERTQPGRWADFETDKFMLQVPRDWIYAYPDPVTAMGKWDSAMDAVSDLMGLPKVRSKTVMYAQADVILRADVNAPGYPMSNEAYDPYNTAANNSGNRSSYLLTGPDDSPWATLHELGHGHLFTKFTGEVESAVNLLYAAAMDQKFGLTLDNAFGSSIGAPADRTTVNLRYVSLMWTLKADFRTGDKRMADADMRYQHRGHAKYVEIANLFGWDALGDFWRSVHDDYEKGIDYSENSDPTDSRIVRMSKAAGYDLRPLLHFWGVPPLAPTTVKNSIIAAGLPASGAIYRRLKYYQTVVPTSQSSYNTFYYAIDGTGPDDEIKGMFTNSSYTTAIGDSTKAAIQGIIDLYFPSGDPDLIAVPSYIWDIAPGIVGVGDGAVTPSAGNWNTTTANWTSDAGANNALWTNNADATFGSGSYQVTLASGVSTRNLTIPAGAGVITLKAAADNGVLTLYTSPTWNIGDNTLNINADGVTDAKLSMLAGHVLTVTGSGTFNTGEKPVGADWSVAGADLNAQGTVKLRGNALGVGKFSSVTMLAGTSYYHEKNVAETYPNNWSLSGTGTVLFDSRYAVTPNYSGEISGTGGVNINGTATLSGTNNYTGNTLVTTGTLNLTGSRTEIATGGITVGNGNGSTAVLNFSNGNYTTGTISVGSGNASSTGVFNQTSGFLTMTGTQLILGNLGTGTTAGTASFGTYNLSGGALTGTSATTRGVMLGTNNGTTGTFNLSGTGYLQLGSAILMVGRSDSPVTGSSGYFNQTGGTAEVGTLTIAGGTGTGNIGHLNLTGGVFTATAFTALSTVASGIGTITVGGTALATLPAFPTVRGASSTATLYFNGGTLIPAATSATYINGLTNAFIKTAGAKFNVPSGRDITVSQILRVDPASTGGGLTKLGTGVLTLTGLNTYNGSTNVSAGKLSITQPYLGNAADVMVSAGSIIDLNFSGTDAIDEFFINGIRQFQGTWGGLTSTATYKTALITGTGMLNVTSGPVTTTAFENWTNSFGLDGSPGKEAGFTEDPDGDGFANGLEWILGANPLNGTDQPIQVTTTGTHLIISFTRADASESTTQLVAQWGGGLSNWSGVTIGPVSASANGDGVVVTVTENGTAPDAVVVTVPRTLATDNRLFTRLRAVLP